MQTWLNGTAVEGQTASFDLSDRGLLLGDGVFDTALVIDGRIVYRQAHLARLIDACRATGIDADRAALAAAMEKAAQNLDFGAIRLTVTRGPGPRGLVPRAGTPPTLIASNTGLDPGVAFKPVRLCTSSIRRNEMSPSSRLKTLAYLDAILASRDAVERGFDEPLFLNTRDRVACAAIGNLFFLAGDTLATPPLQEGVLPGILRGVILRLAPGLGLSAVERPVTPGEVQSADAAFVCSSLKLIAPVDALDEHRFSAGSRPLLARLAQAVCDDLARDSGIPAAPFKVAF